MYIEVSFSKKDPEFCLSEEKQETVSLRNHDKVRYLNVNDITGTDQVVVTLTTEQAKELAKTIALTLLKEEIENEVKEEIENEK